MRGVAAALAALATALAGAAAGAGDAADVAARPPQHDAIPQGPTVDERLAEIGARVQRVVQYPASARERGVEGETRVAFRVAPDGRAADIAVAESSGSLALDRAAERAVRAAGPLPAIYGRITVPVRFALRDAPTTATTAEP